MKYCRTAMLLCVLLTVAPSRAVGELGRGLAGIKREDGTVFLSWRFLAADSPETRFNLYRALDGGHPELLNTEPLFQTHFIAEAPPPRSEAAYILRAVLDGKETGGGRPFILAAAAPAAPFFSIPLQTLEGHRPNDGAPGDLDGDGEYDLVLKQEMRPRDNSRRGRTGTTKLEGYTLGGSFLWRIDLGPNIREGAHYTPFIVFDLDGDGIAEVAARTSEGTTDGTDRTIGDVNGDGRTEYVNPETGYILEGPEFISIFDGRTGAELARTNYIARGRVSDWGDDYGNRVDRFLMGVAYLDGERPSLILCRGYYALTKLEAWNWRGGKLEKVWSFSSGDPGNEGYAGQGNHNLSIGDVDGDGRDEIIYGACAIDDDGSGLYTTGLGHGDAMHLSDMDPSRPGLEVFGIHEEPAHPHGAALLEAATGRILWSKPSADAGRGVAMDIDPRHYGYEMWASGPGLRGLWDARGAVISDAKPRSCNMGAWWDGDLLRELLDRTSISKWNWENGSTERLISAGDFDCVSNNGSKANPVFAGDILGDWREEVIWRTRDNRELRIFMTTIPTPHRLPALMENRAYRIGSAVQNVGYNQPAHPSFFLGEPAGDADGSAARPATEE